MLISLLLLLSASVPCRAAAPDPEGDLLQQAYDLLLSSDSRGALEALRSFLDRYPASSARDAALFWLGRAQTNLNMHDEAAASLAALKKDYPESPFLPFVAAELAEQGKSRSGQKLKESPEKARPEEGSAAPQAPVKVTPQAETVKTEILLREEQQRNAELTRQLEALRQEQQRQTGTGDRVTHLLPQDGLVRINGRSVAQAEIIAYQVQAALALKRFGMERVLWHSGNPVEDFMTEELLFAEAQKAGIGADAERVQQIAGERKLTAPETAYLDRLMTIAAYVSHEYRDEPPEQWVELLSVDYRPGDGTAKSSLASDLQKAAREGKAFPVLARQHADSVAYSRLSLQDFTARYRDRSQIAQKLNFMQEETAVIWSDKGFMLLKPVLVRPGLDLFQDMPPQKQEGYRSFIRSLLAEKKKLLQAQ